MTTKTTTRVYEPKKFEELRFEFLLYINNHIICQRFFDIKNFDEKNYQKNIKELMDSLTGMNNGKYGTLGIIPNFLKERSKDFIWANYNPYATTQEVSVKSIFDKIDDFQFELRVDRKTVAKSIFSGNYFPPKVRYAVDIKQIIPSIISEISYYFGS